MPRQTGKEVASERSKLEDVPDVAGSQNAATCRPVAGGWCLGGVALAKIIDFFPRQTLAGNSASIGKHYSQIFELTEETSLDVRLIVSSNTSVAQVSGFLEESSDPSLADQGWKVVAGNFGLVTGISGLHYSGLARFVRARVEVPSAAAVTLSMQGVARMG